MTIPKLYAPQPPARFGTESPEAIAAPAGLHVALVLVADGVQKYECRAKETGFAWLLTGPDARLYDADDKLVGKHYAGPTWEYKDGSSVVGVAIAHAPSANPHSIDQLLVRVAAHGGQGMLEHVSTVQRLKTYGGVAPETGCSAAEVGHQTEVEYSAEYVFYAPS